MITVETSSAGVGFSAIASRGAHYIMRPKERVGSETMNLRGFLLALAAVLSSADAMAADVKVLASNSVRTMLEDVAPLFERATGHKVGLGFGTSAQVAKRVAADEAVDVLIVTPDVVRTLALADKGKLAIISNAVVARSLMGIGVRAGTPHPDIGTPAALRKTLLAVKAVTFSDPATGAASGVHTVKIFEQLGIADEMKPKYRLGDGTSSGRLVVSGEADLAIWQISAMKPVKGLDIVGPLPADLQLVTTLVSALTTGAVSSKAARTFIEFLRTPEAAAAMRARGLEPGGG
jgi:molybdate transport system substrate-binding protein